MKAVSRFLFGAAALAFATASAGAQDGGMQKWIKGKGWGWVWGPQDGVGNLNEMTDATGLAALKLVTQGKTYDLGLPYDRHSYKWPGHSPGENISFRSPLGVRSQKDLPFTTPEGGNTRITAWHSNAIFINDNVATQIDGLPERGRNTDRNREGFEQGGSFSRGQFERERNPRKYEEPTETGSFFRGGGRTY